MAIRTDVFDYAGPQDESRGSDITATGPVGLGGVNRTADTDEVDRSFLDKYIAYHNARAADADEGDRSFLDKYIAHYNGTGPALYDSSRTSAFYAPLRRQSPMPEDFLSLKGPARRKAEKYLSGLNTPEQMDSWRNTIAERQSDAARLLNGTVKMTALAGTTFLDNTIGLAVGLGTGIYNTMDGDKDTSFGSGIWDNWFNRKMDGVNRWMDESFPNYYTDFEADESNTWKNVFSANFIGDKFIKNLGFTLGAAGSMFLTGGVAGAAGLSRGIAGAALKAGVNARRAVGVGKAVDMGVGALVASIGEGSIEALNAADQFSTDRLRMLEERHGRMMQAIEDDPLLTPEKKRQFMEQETREYEALASREAADAARVGNTTLALNIPILTASNLIQFSKLLGNGYRSASRVTGAIKKAKDAAEGTYRSTRRLWKDVAGGVYRSSVTEGMEEVEQQLASDTATALQDRDMLGYIASLGRADSPVYAGMDREDAELLALWNSSLASPYANGQTVSMVKTVGRQLVETLTANSTWEQFLIGAMTGAMGMPTVSTDVNTRDARSNWGHIDAGRLHFGMTGGAVGQIAANREETGRVRRMVETMNRVASEPGIREFTVSLTRHAGTQALMDAALDEGDEKTYKDAELEQLVGDVMPFIYSGRKADLIDMVTSAAEDLDEGDADEIIRTTSRTVTGPDGKPRLVGPFIMADGNPMPAEEVLRRIRANAARIKETVKRIEDALDATDYATHGALKDGQLQRLAVMKLHEMDWADRTVSVAEELEDFFRRHEDLFQGKSGRSGEAGQGPMYRMKRSFRLFGRGGSEERIRSLEERPVHEVIADYARNIRDAGDGIRIAEKDAAGIEEYFGRVYEAVKASEAAAEEKEKVLSQIRDLIRMARSTAAFQGARDMFTADPKAMDIDAEELKKRTEGAVRERRAMHYARRLNSDGRYRDFRTFHDAVSRIPEEDRKRLLELMGNDPRVKQYRENTDFAETMRRKLDALKGKTIRSADGKESIKVTDGLYDLERTAIELRETTVAPKEDGSVNTEEMERWDGGAALLDRNGVMITSDSGNKVQLGHLPEVMSSVDEIYRNVAVEAGKNADSARASKRRQEMKKNEGIEGEDTGNSLADDNTAKKAKALNGEFAGKRFTGIDGMVMKVISITGYMKDTDGQEYVAIRLKDKDGVITEVPQFNLMTLRELISGYRDGQQEVHGSVQPASDVNPTGNGAGQEDSATEIATRAYGGTPAGNGPSSGEGAQDSRQRNYITNSTPEFDFMALRQGRQEPPGGVEHQWGTWTILNSLGAYDYVNRGNLHRGDSVRFMVDPSLSKYAPPEEVKMYGLDRLIYMVHTDKDGIDHVIGVLPQSTAVMSGFVGLSGLSAAILATYDANGNRDRWFADGYETEVLRVRKSDLPAVRGKERSLELTWIPSDSVIMFDGAKAYVVMDNGATDAAGSPVVHREYLHAMMAADWMQDGWFEDPDTAPELFNYMRHSLANAIGKAMDASLTGKELETELNKALAVHFTDYHTNPLQDGIGLRTEGRRQNITNKGRTMSPDDFAMSLLGAMKNLNARLKIRMKGMDRHLTEMLIKSGAVTVTMTDGVLHDTTFELKPVVVNTRTGKRSGNDSSGKPVPAFSVSSRRKTGTVFQTFRVNGTDIELTLGSMAPAATIVDRNGHNVDIMDKELRGRIVACLMYHHLYGKGMTGGRVIDGVWLMDNGMLFDIASMTFVTGERAKDVRKKFMQLQYGINARNVKAHNMIATVLERDTPDASVTMAGQNGKGNVSYGIYSNVTTTDRSDPVGIAVSPHGNVHIVISNRISEAIGNGELAAATVANAVKDGTLATLPEFRSLYSYLYYGVFFDPGNPGMARDMNETFNWGRIADGGAEGYEVSSAGDKRFSALRATFKSGTMLFGHDVGERTIESVYQHGVKQGDWTTDNNRKTGKPKSKEIIKGNTEDSSYEQGYLPLWKEWAKQNPELIEGLRTKAAEKVLTDKYAITSVSQARALADILNGSGTGRSAFDKVNETFNHEKIRDHRLTQIEKTRLIDEIDQSANQRAVTGKSGTAIFRDKYGNEGNYEYGLALKNNGEAVYWVLKPVETVVDGIVVNAYIVGVGDDRGAVLWIDGNTAFDTREAQGIVAEAVENFGGLDAVIAKLSTLRGPVVAAGPQVSGADVAAQRSEESDYTGIPEGTAMEPDTVETEDDDDDNLEFRLVTGAAPPVSQRSVPRPSVKQRREEARRRELEWLKNAYPDLSGDDRLKIVKGLIPVAERGEAAWGQFHNGIITLSDVAARGTLYHEAFHAVAHQLMTSEELAKMLDDARHGRKMGDTEVEEELAERFRMYMQRRESGRGLGRRILDFFENLWFKITHLDSVNMDTYFARVYEGNFNGTVNVYSAGSGFLNDGTVARAFSSGTSGYDAISAEEKEILDSLGIDRDSCLELNDRELEQLKTCAFMM